MIYTILIGINVSILKTTIEVFTNSPGGSGTVAGACETQVLAALGWHSCQQSVFEASTDGLSGPETGCQRPNLEIVKPSSKNRKEFKGDMIIYSSFFSVLTIHNNNYLFDIGLTIYLFKYDLDY